MVTKNIKCLRKLSYILLTLSSNSFSLSIQAMDAKIGEIMESGRQWEEEGRLRYAALQNEDQQQRDMEKIEKIMESGRQWEGEGRLRYAALQNEDQRSLRRVTMENFYTCLLSWIDIAERLFHHGDISTLWK